MFDGDRRAALDMFSILVNIEWRGNDYAYAFALGQYVPLHLILSLFCLFVQLKKHIREHEGVLA